MKNSTGRAKARDLDGIGEDGGRRVAQTLSPATLPAANQMRNGTREMKGCRLPQFGVLYYVVII